MIYLNETHTVIIHGILTKSTLNQQFVKANVQNSSIMELQMYAVGDKIHKLTFLYKTDVIFVNNNWNICWLTYLRP